MTKSAKDPVAEPIKLVESVPAEEAAKLVGNSEVVFIDVREGEELRNTGTVQGAIHVPCGLSESQANPASPSHNPELGSGRRLVLYCAAGGDRSVPAARSLKEMGTESVAHVAGAFAAQEEAGASIQNRE